jgi:hypothetical protein
MVQTRDATMERNPKLPLSADSKTKLLRELQGTIHFEKMLTAISRVKGLGNKYKLISVGCESPHCSCQAEYFQIPELMMV